ncbi:hypothetical protein JXA32_04885 [Candidatus Sumerlaeota bacterium]|nr:hypothetical protein [Candidatus Sumerlaeota bacterium]
MAFDAWMEQQARNDELLKSCQYLRPEIESRALPFTLDVNAQQDLSAEEEQILNALSIDAARTAIRTLASLAKINELDHLGGGLDLIPAHCLTMAVTDNVSKTYTVEHAHTSIGHYATLSAYGFLEPDCVVEQFRRSLDIPGHISWVPGGTQLNGGRLGIMVPVAVGQALGLKGRHGKDAWTICHMGDAGWISGQALNGFNAADLHGAPITFVMHRNGIQLSGSNKQIMDKDPRGVIASLGIEILEITSLLDFKELYKAYCEAHKLAQQGRPAMIYPVGLRSDANNKVDLGTLGELYGIGDEVAKFAAKNDVAMDTEIWIPGSLMGYRDIGPMLECIFLVNDLPGGAGHHDGHMKGRDEAEVLAGTMLQLSEQEQALLQNLRDSEPRIVVTKARPKPGSPNLVVSEDALKLVELPPVGKSVSPRAGSEIGYHVVAKQFPEAFFSVGCDLDPSTKFAKAHKALPKGHVFEVSIEEQVAALLADGLAMSSAEPQLNTMATFAAFFEGIAREGFELWRYQRNLNGVNEGLNVTLHLSHVGAFTGRDHFSGWSLDWITLCLGYLPYLHRFYAPADARAAFLAVRDLAAHYGGHIICIPRDNLPILAKQDGSGALWEANSLWEDITVYRKFDGAKKAILAIGAPAFLAGEAAEELSKSGANPVDALILNSLPLPEGALEKLFAQYPGGIVTVEDGIIGTPEAGGLRGIAGMFCSANKANIPLAHVGIVDPRTAPSHGWEETWEHFGITRANIVRAVQSLR